MEIVNPVESLSHDGRKELIGGRGILFISNQPAKRLKLEPSSSEGVFHHHGRSTIQLKEEY